MKTKTCLAPFLLGFIFFSALNLPAGTNSTTRLAPRHSSFHVDGMMVIGPQIDPGRRWNSPFGTTHYRGMISKIRMEGDVEGTGYYEQDSDWDSEGNGFLRGDLEINVQIDGMKGKFAGRWSGKMTGFYITGKFIAQGSGDFAGKVWTCSFVGGANGPFDYSGDILGL